MTSDELWKRIKEDGSVPVTAANFRIVAELLIPGLIRITEGMDGELYAEHESDGK